MLIVSYGEICSLNYEQLRVEQYRARRKLLSMELLQKKRLKIIGLHGLKGRFQRSFNRSKNKDF